MKFLVLCLTVLLVSSCVSSNISRNIAQENSRDRARIHVRIKLFQNGEEVGARSYSLEELPATVINANTCVANAVQIAQNGHPSLTSINRDLTALD